MATNDEELEHLREENNDLKREVAKLSAEMDQINHRRHQKKKPANKVDADSKINPVPAEVRHAIKQNEDLRRERLKLTTEMKHSDTGRRISETKNALADVEREIAHKLDELKALENQRKMRKEVVEMAHHTEEELRMFKSQHREELNGFKDEATGLSDEQKLLDRQMIAMQVHIHRINEKIKLGVNGDAFADLKAKVQAQDDEIATFNAEIDKMAADIEAASRREDSELRGLKNDRKMLLERIEMLKQTQVERERELKLSYAMMTSPRPAPISPASGTRP